MNIANFQQAGGFPLETDTLTFMQKAYEIFNSFTALAGDLAILRGCTVNNGVVSDGIVVIDGEILPFVGGSVSADSTVIIDETWTSKEFEIGDVKDVYATRVARFGSGDTQYKWSRFRHIRNVQQLLANINHHHHSWEQITGKPSYYPTTWELIYGKPDYFTTSWDSITGKPSTFPSLWDSINGKPSTFPPSSHSHAWSQITGKPSTFPPSTHSHSWSQVTGKPSKYPPAEHSHDLNDLEVEDTTEFTSIPVTMGGYEHGGSSLRYRIKNSNYYELHGVLNVINGVEGSEYCTDEWIGVDANRFPNGIGVGTIVDEDGTIKTLFRIKGDEILLPAEEMFQYHGVSGAKYYLYAHLPLDVT